MNGRATDALDVLTAEHAMQLELCDCLEHLADSLPDQVDRRLARAVACIIREDVAKHFAWEEEALFPVLLSHAHDHATLSPILRQLEAEHERDEDYASEIAESLSSFADTGVIGNAEMLAYMLRGFFEGQRRHVTWEDTLLVPLARSILDAEELQRLADRSVLIQRLERVDAGRKILQRWLSRT
jgi:hemerythrin-like domain-containing protein